MEIKSMGTIKTIELKLPKVKKCAHTEYWFWFIV